MSQRIRAGLLGLVAALVAPAGLAGEAQDRIFALALLAPVATGETLIYRHVRTGSFEPETLEPVPDGMFAVEIAPGADGRREALVTRSVNGAAQSQTALPADAGHPLLLIFLESVVRDVAALSGGSPFYIRNRIREALAQPTTPVALDAGERLSFTPFRADPNRAKLGALADLEISFDLGDTAPGRFARFAAVAGPAGAPALSETITFDRIEEE